MKDVDHHWSDDLRVALFVFILIAVAAIGAAFGALTLVLWWML